MYWNMGDICYLLSQNSKGLLKCDTELRSHKWNVYLNYKKMKLLHRESTLSKLKSQQTGGKYFYAVISDIGLFSRMYTEALQISKERLTSQ